jgi:HEPN domain-containing protein
MKPKDPTDPQAWLLRARGNLNLAEKGGRLKGVLLEDLCFNAQQAAEKALKAVCLAYEIEIPKTHSLIHLMDIWRLVESKFRKMPEMQIFLLNMLCNHVIQASWKRSRKVNIGRR